MAEFNVPVKDSVELEALCDSVTVPADTHRDRVPSDLEASLDGDIVAVTLVDSDGDEGSESREGKHMLLETPPGKHWQMANFAALTLHVLLMTVSGPKQSALALQDPHAPAEMVPVGSSEDPAGTRTPLTVLHRWYIFPPPAPRLTDEALHIEHPVPHVHVLSRIERVPGVAHVARIVMLLLMQEL